MYNVALLIMCITIFLLFICYLFPIRIRVGECTIICAIIMISLAIISYYAEPGVSTDLYAHYYIMDCIRNGSGYTSTPLIVWEILIRVISYSRHNSLLPVCVWLMILYFIIGIIKYYHTVFHNKTKNFIYFLIIFFGTCTVYYIMSGLRNSLVAVMWGYAYTKYYNSSKSKYYVISIIACFIHVYAIVPMSIVFLQELSKVITKRMWKIVYIVVATIPVWNNILLNAFESISIKFFNYVAFKIRLYVGWDNIDITSMIKVSIVVLILLLVMMERNNLEKKYFDFVSFFLFSNVMIGFVYPIFFTRLSYIVGVFTPGIIGATEKKKTRILLSCIVVLCLFVIVVDVYSMIAHVNFNGIDYYDLLIGR